MLCAKCGAELPETGICECDNNISINTNSTEPIKPIESAETTQNKTPYKMLVFLNIFSFLICGIISCVLLNLLFKEYGIIEVTKNLPTLKLMNAFALGILTIVSFVIFFIIPVLSLFYVITALQGKGKTAHKIGGANVFVSILAPILIITVWVLTNFVKETYETLYYGFLSSTVSSKVSELLFADGTPVAVFIFTLIALIFGAILLNILKNNAPLEGSPFSGVKRISSGIDKQKVSEMTRTATITAGKIGKSAVEIGKSIEFDARDEDNATASIKGKLFKIGLVNKIISIMLIILFFLPVISMKLYTTKVTANGWTTAFGVKILGTRVGGSFIFIFLLLIPIALFAAYQFKQKITFVQGKLFMISAVLAGAGLLVYLIGMSSLNGSINSATVGITFWSFLSILLYILAGAISIGCYASAKKKPKE